MIEVTKQHLDDPNIELTDSCAVPDHPVMSRLWSERQADRHAGDRHDARGRPQQPGRPPRRLHLYRETRNFARLVRNRVRKPAQASLTEPVTAAASRPRTVAEDAADDLAGRGQRHLIDELDLARIFMCRERFAHPLADLGGERVDAWNAVLQHHIGLDDLGPHCDQACRPPPPAPPAGWPVRQSSISPGRCGSRPR